MAREAELVLPTHAGPEIGVASTKAFTCQLGVLAAFAANLARAKGRLDAEHEKRIVQLLAEVPAAMQAALAHDARIAPRPEEHPPELQSLLRNPYALLCSHKKTQPHQTHQ